MKKLVLLLVLSAGMFSAQAQTSAGQAFRIDYDEFQANGIVKYLAAASAEDFNTGNELTAMAWIQLRDIGDNQKIMGRFNLDNSGFVLGVNQFRVYPEVWNPTLYDPQDFGFMNPLEQWWYHVAFSYTAGDAMRVYLNGDEVGSVPVSGNPVTSNDHDLIIGVSPWEDFNNFQTFGNLDEVTIMNVALTGDEIRQAMHAGMTGDEEGLVVAYNFNDASGEDAPDLSPAGHTASGVGFSGSEWVESTAPIANANTATGQDLRAVWNGLTLMDPRFTTSSNGLNLLANDLDTTDFVVFGHNGATGLSTDDIPAEAPADFMRTSRIWPANARGGAPVDFIFNLADAAGGSDELDGTQAAENYTLLWREAGNTTFVPVAQGNSIASGIVTFEDFSAFDGDFAIGVGSAPIEPNSVSDLMASPMLHVVPNPNQGVFEIRWDALNPGETAYIEVLNSAGAKVISETVELQTQDARRSMDLRQEGAGVYIVRMVLGNYVATKRVVVR